MMNTSLNFLCILDMILPPSLRKVMSTFLASKMLWTLHFSIEQSNQGPLQLIYITYHTTHLNMSTPSDTVLDEFNPEEHENIPAFNAVFSNIEAWNCHFEWLFLCLGSWEKSYVTCKCMYRLRVLKYRNQRLFTN